MHIKFLTEIIWYLDLN